MKFAPGSIPALRAKLGMNQAEFAAFVAKGSGHTVSRETVSRWEAGGALKSPAIYNYVQALLTEHADSPVVTQAAEADRLRAKLAAAMQWLDLPALSRLSPLILEELARCTAEERARSRGA